MKTIRPEDLSLVVSAEIDQGRYTDPENETSRTPQHRSITVDGAAISTVFSGLKYHSLVADRSEILDDGFTSGTTTHVRLVMRDGETRLYSVSYYGIVVQTSPRREDTRYGRIALIPDFLKSMNELFGNTPWKKFNVARFLAIQCCACPDNPAHKEAPG